MRLFNSVECRSKVNVQGVAARGPVSVSPHLSAPLKFPMVGVFRAAPDPSGLPLQRQLRQEARNAIGCQLGQ